MSRYFFILILILSAIPFTAYGQSERSDSLYAIGVDLYHAGKYAEAIPIFREVSRDDTIFFSSKKLASGAYTCRLNYGPSWEAACYYKLGDAETAKRIMPSDYMEEPIDRRITGKCDEYNDMVLDGWGSEGEALMKLYFDWMIDEEKRVLGSEHWSVANSYFMKAWWLSSHQLYNEAEMAALQAIAIYKAIGSQKEYLNGAVKFFRAGGELWRNNINEAAVLAREAVKELRNSVEEMPHLYIDALRTAFYISFSPETKDEFLDMAKTAFSDFINADHFGEPMLNGVWEVASALHTAGIFDEALPMVKDAIKKGTEKGFGECYGMSLLHVLDSKLKVSAQDFIGASESVDHAIAIQSKVNVPDWISLGETYELKATCEQNLGHYAEAMESAQRSIAEFEKLKEYAPAGLWRSHYILACSQLHQREYKEAVESLHKVLEAMRSIKWQNPDDYAFIESELAGAYTALEQSAESMDAMRRAIGYYERGDTYDINPAYFNLKINLAGCLILAGKRDEGERMLAEVENRIDRGDEFGKNLKGPYCGLVAELRVNTGDYATARRLVAIADSLDPSGMMFGCMQANLKLLLLDGRLEDVKTAITDHLVKLEASGASPEMTVGMLTSFANITAMHLPQSAKEYADRAIEISKTLPWTHNKWNNLRTLLGVISNSGDSETLLRLVEEVEKQIQPDNIRAKIELTLYRGQALAADGDISGARNAVAIASQLLSSFDDMQGFFRLQCMMLDAVCDENEGLFTEAIEKLEHLDSDIVERPEKYFSQLRQQVAMRLQQLGQKTANRDLQFRSMDVMEEMIRQNVGENSPEFAPVQVRRAQMLALDGKIDEGLEVMRKMVEKYSASGDGRITTTLMQWKMNYEVEVAHFEEALSTGHDILALSKKGNIRISAYIIQKMMQAANMLGRFQDALDIAAEIDHPLVIQMTDRFGKVITDAQIAQACLGEKDFNRGYEYMKGVFSETQQMVLENFLTMTEAERRDLWNSLYILFRDNIPWAAAHSSYQPRFNELAYDATLFSTSLLLQSDKTVNDLLANEKDRKIRKLSKALASAQQQLANAREKEKNGEIPLETVETLRLQKEKAEKELLKSLKSRMGHYNAGLAVKWQDVRSALGEGEAAVEFLELQYSDSLKSYFALILRPDYESPHMIFLPFAGTIDFSDKENYRTRAVYDDFWHPLADELTGCSRVWFAVQGSLCTFAIESVPGLEELTGNPATSYCRLTSTREIVQKKNHSTGSGAVLYGGIDYKAGKNRLVEDAKKYSYQTGRHRSFPFELREIAPDSARGAFVGIDLLPGTLDEINTLEPIIKGNSLFKGGKVTTHSGDKATEASLKSLSGKGKSLLHIGTHGFYYNGNSKLWNGYFGESAKTPEELAMERSGLLFAGAEGPLCAGVKLPTGVEDGVLTAAEISWLDLSGLDLTVLSACETALGRVSADGVFGLQRGFKKAGAGAMLMSLWKVDDKATAHLMKEFYREWLGGKSKYEALEIAKASVRSCPGWDDPDYWAAFILIDGI